MILVSSCSCLCPILWSQVLSREWRCSWSSADRRCFNYIWVINNLIAYLGVSYIRDFSVYCCSIAMQPLNEKLTWKIFLMHNSLKRKCYHFDKIFVTGCTESCHFDNFRCSQWWKFHQNEDISFQWRTGHIIQINTWATSKSFIFQNKLCWNIKKSLPKSTCPTDSFTCLKPAVG